MARQCHSVDDQPQLYVSLQAGGTGYQHVNDVVDRKSNASHIFFLKTLFSGRTNDHSTRTIYHSAIGRVLTLVLHDGRRG